MRPATLLGGDRLLNRCPAVCYQGHPLPSGEDSCLLNETKTLGIAAQLFTTRALISFPSILSPCHLSLQIFLRPLYHVSCQPRLCRLL
jgi:hypothetical protein